MPLIHFPNFCRLIRHHIEPRRKIQCQCIFCQQRLYQKGLSLSVQGGSKWFNLSAF